MLGLKDWSGLNVGFMEISVHVYEKVIVRVWIWKYPYSLGVIYYVLEMVKPKNVLLH